MTELVPYTFTGEHIGNLDVRTVTDEKGQPWFVAQDVCRVLGYKHTPSAIRRLDEDEYSQVTPNVRPGYVGPPPRPMTVVSEPGLYSLMLSSKKPEAQRFRDWITDEVLPTIRKTGGIYIAPGSQAADLAKADPQAFLDSLRRALEIAQQAKALTV
jgi:anti-repressor protein